MTNTDLPATSNRLITRFYTTPVGDQTMSTDRPTTPGVFGRLPFPPLGDMYTVIGEKRIQPNLKNSPHWQVQV
jgi:hypothetical protein